MRSERDSTTTSRAAAGPGGDVKAPSNRAGWGNDQWLELDRKYRIQSRFTHPISFDRGDGSHLSDADGTDYLDFESGQVCASVGHSHPAFIEAVKRQLDRLVQTGSCYVADIQIEFQEKLAQTSNNAFQKSYLACSGSESNEAALRLAKSYTGRTEIASFMGNYHGHTYGSWSITGFGGAARTGYGPPMSDVTFLPTPYSYPVPGNIRFPHRDEAVIDACVRYCELMLDSTTSGRPAAIIIELVQSAAGIREMPASFLKAVRRICDERGALMIVDEAQTGVGRLGTWWGYEQFGIVPDVITASKTLGGGMPLSAVLCSAKLADEAVARGYRQSSSHTGDPLLAAAGLATLEIIERDGLLKNVRQVGAYLKQELTALCDESPVGGEVRGRGLLLGVEFVRSKSTGEPNQAATQLFTDECRRRGLLTGWWKVPYLAPNVVRLMPPYTVSREEADQALSIIKDAMLKAQDAR